MDCAAPAELGGAGFRFGEVGEPGIRISEIEMVGVIKRLKRRLNGKKFFRKSINTKDIYARRVDSISSSMVQRLGFIAFTDTAGVRLPVGEHFAGTSRGGVRRLLCRDVRYTQTLCRV